MGGTPPIPPLSGPCSSVVCVMGSAPLDPMPQPPPQWQGIVGINARLQLLGAAAPFRGGLLVSLRGLLLRLRGRLDPGHLLKQRSV